MISFLVVFNAVKQLRHLLISIIKIAKNLYVFCLSTRNKSLSNSLLRPKNRIVIRVAKQFEQISFFIRSSNVYIFFHMLWIILL